MESYVACSLGDYAAAERAATESLAEHETYGDRRGSAQARWALGMAVAGQGRYVEANAHHKGALVIFSEVGDLYFTGVCFIGLAQVALAAGRPRDAVCLLAADSTLMAELGAPRWPSIRPYIQRTLDTARTALDGTAFDAAWTAGSRVSVERAVVLAMEIPDPRQSGKPPGRRGNRVAMLTEREREVARGIAGGLTNKQIAAKLVIAEGTADRHVANILDKLGYRTRAQIAAWVVTQPMD